MSATPSTSNDGHAGIKKDKLVARVDRRARARYGQGLSAGQLDSWISAGLVPRAKRSGNEGRRPIYEFDWRAYRRTLQVIRFRQAGITNQNEILIMLYLRRYGVPAWQVRDALVRVFVATVRSLLAPIRSTRVDTMEPIPPRHFVSLQSSWGELDSALREAGLVLPPEVILGALRSAKQRSIEPLVEPTLTAELLFEPFSTGSAFARLAMHMFGGLINVGEVDDPTAAPVAGTVQHLIVNSSDSTLDNVRDIIRFFILGLEFGSKIATKTGNSKFERVGVVATKVASSINDSPHWAALMLVLGLRLVDSNFAGLLENVRQIPSPVMTA